MLRTLLSNMRSSCPLWDGWLRDQELGNLDDSEPEYISALISKKYFELASIIQDTLTQTLMSRKREHLETTRWIQLSLNRLNTRFWNWYDSLPGDMRWNRWASSSETVYPNIAEIQYENSLSSVLSPLF